MMIPESVTLAHDVARLRAEVGRLFTKDLITRRHLDDAFRSLTSALTATRLARADVVGHLPGIVA